MAQKYNRLCKSIATSVTCNIGSGKMWACKLTVADWRLLNRHRRDSLSQISQALWNHPSWKKIKKESQFTASIPNFFNEKLM